MKLPLPYLPLCLAALLLPGAALALDAPEAERANAKFQATYIWQTKPGFPAAYSGVNSLSAAPEKSYSFITTSL